MAFHTEARKTESLELFFLKSSGENHYEFKEINFQMPLPLNVE
jgi:hypothetical protein